MTMVPDIRSLDGKVRPTISGPLAYYIRELLRTGLYGGSPSEVVRTLVREGIIKAASGKLVELKEFPTRNKP